MRSSKLLFVGALLASVFAAPSAWSVAPGCTTTGGTPTNDPENTCSGTEGDPVVVGSDTTPEGSPGGDGPESGPDTSGDSESGNDDGDEGQL